MGQAQSATYTRYQLMQARLAALGASTPSCVYCGKVTNGSANPAFRRLPALSLGDGNSDVSHIAEAFTDGELASVVDGAYRHGLAVPVLDADRRGYVLRCVYAEETGLYVLAGDAECRSLMVDNGVTGDKEMAMVVFAFRSPVLRRVVGSVEDDHPDGVLRMIVLFLDPSVDDTVFGNEELDIKTLTLEQIMKHYP